MIGILSSHVISFDSICKHEEKMKHYKVGEEKRNIGKIKSLPITHSLISFVGQGGDRILKKEGMTMR